MATQELDKVTSKVSNVHTIRSVIIAPKLKTKISQKVGTCQYKIDTGNDGTVIVIRISKVLFLHANINELNKSFNRKRVLCTYINSSI